MAQIKENQVSSGAAADGEVLTADGAGAVDWEAASGGSWELISETVLTGSVASVTFSTIPGTYRTLVIVIRARSDRVAESDSVFLASQR